MSLAPRPYQSAAVDRARKAIAAGKRRILLVAPTGCHTPGQAILMFDGTTKPVEKISIGDALMGPDSTPRRVERLVHGTGEMFDIKPVKGSAFRVNDEHVLSLVRTNDGWGKSNTTIDVKVRDWLKWSRTHKHIHKLFRAPVEFQPITPLALFPEISDLAIDPYFLGVLLGDGTTKNYVGVTTMDREIVEACYEAARAWGLTIRVETAGGTRCPTYVFNGERNRSNVLAQTLRELGVYGCSSADKHIPFHFKVASRESRLQVLAGLLDTDGALSRGGFDFVSKSAQLSADVAFVARSLGFAAYVSACQKYAQTGNGGEYFRVSISGDLSSVPCRIPRKRAPRRSQIKDVLRTGFSVSPAGRGEFFGFTLDHPDGRYLLDDFTVTHNSGKTVVATMIVDGAIARGRRVLVLAHRAEIIEQTSAKLDAINVDHGVIQADHWRRRAWLPVQVASVPTLTRRLARKPEADVIILDEAHHVSAQSFRAIIDAYPEAILIGLTATPYRTDGRALGDVFEELIVVAQVRELIDQGFLVQPRFFAPFNPDLSGVHTTAGDFNQHETQDLMNRPKLIGDIVENWKSRADGLTTVCFASGIAHSKAIVERFQAAGVAAAHLDGTTPAAQRSETLRRLARGEIRVLSNMGILTEGWDLPGCACAILARPTESKSLHNQMIGRVLRAAPGKSACIVLDHAGNVIRHGFPTDHQEFSLEGREKRSKEPTPSVRVCKRCYAAFPAREVACPECGWKPEAKPVKLISEGAGELVEVTDQKRTGAIASDREKARLLAKWRATAEARGYRPGWASVQYKTLFLAWPPPEIESASKLIHFPAWLVYEARCLCGSTVFGCDESRVTCRGCGEARWKVPAELQSRAVAWMATRARADERLREAVG